MMAPTLTLESLPNELQGAIFRLLDPSGLINVSQTCTRFRAAIRPGRQHFVERLLALECLEEFGGRHIRFRARDNAQEPAWDDDTVQGMRWACSHCLRLLSHQHFDNHSLLRLRYRKPEPGSPAALPLTSWEPTGHVASKAVSRKRREASRKEMQGFLRRYTIAVTLNGGDFGQASEDRLASYREAGMEVFEQMTYADFVALSAPEEIEVLDGVARSVELRLCGYRRHQRRCIECRYQLGDLRSHTVMNTASDPPRPYQTGANAGTADVPMVKSRRIAYGSLVGRLFPGFLADLPSYKPGCERAPIFTIYRQDARENYYTNYMIRCPGCSSWKEMAAFRCGNTWPKFWPAYRHIWGSFMFNWDDRCVDKDFVEGLRCHSCFAAEHGRDELAKALLRFYDAFLIPDLVRADHDLQLGWMRVFNSVSAEEKYTRPGEWFARPKHFFDIRTQILSGLPWKTPDDKSQGISNYRDINQQTLEAMHEKHERLKKMFPVWYNLEVATTGYRQSDDWNDQFISWLNGYEALEERFVWLRQCREEAITRPQSLVSWALGDQEGADVSGAEMWEEMSEFYRNKWSALDLSGI